MPLASPSSSTSNTLATFLDHVPISTNNAEKWKPKQMGSNSGGDYWALSKALSAPLGTERWIPHHLFLSAATKVRGEKTVVAICLQVPGTSVQSFKWSFVFRHARNECNGLHLNLPLNFDFPVFLFITKVQMSVLHHLWYFSKRVPHCESVK